MPLLTYTTEDQMNTNSSVTELEVTSTTKSTIEDKAIRPSAYILSIIRVLCYWLVSISPRAARTTCVLKDLLECSSRWASQGWREAILFNVYLTCSLAKVHKELGETTTAIGWYRNTLQMIHDHEAIETTTTKESTVDEEEDGEREGEEGTGFAENDFALGLMRYRLEAMIGIALTLSHPLGEYKEAQKEHENVLDVVQSLLGRVSLYFPQSAISFLLIRERPHTKSGRKTE